MKELKMILLLCLLAAAKAFAQIPEPDGTTSRKDVKNKDEKLRTQNLKDLIMLYDFTYHDEVWDGGQIYDPYSGKTYSCTLKLKDNKLYIRGYMGISLFVRASVWERVK